MIMRLTVTVASMVCNPQVIIWILSYTAAGTMRSRKTVWSQLELHDPDAAAGNSIRCAFDHPQQLSQKPSYI